jgi:hypothetical protein
MNTTNEPTQVAATPPEGIIDDLRQIDWILDETEVPLSEALKVLSYPEVFGLHDPKGQAKALEKRRIEIENVQDCMQRIRDLNEKMTWCYDDDDLGTQHEVLK